MRRRRSECGVPLCDGVSGRIAIYCGCAGSVTGLAFCHADEVVDFIRSGK